MFRCGVTIKNTCKILVDNFNSKEECETWILELMEKHELKKSIIINKDNKQERYIENF